LVLAAAAGQARHFRLKTTSLARSAYPQAAKPLSAANGVSPLSACIWSSSFTTLPGTRPMNKFIFLSVVSPILFKHHIWLFLENQNTIYGGHFLKNFA
jgi:hypothetical protein